MSTSGSDAANHEMCKTLIDLPVYFLIFCSSSFRKNNHWEETRMEAAISIRSILIVALLSSLILAGCGSSTGGTGATISQNGTAIATASATTALTTVPITTAGTLVGIVDWTAPPASMAAFFQRSGDPPSSGALGTPPITITTPVASDKTGDWTLNIVNTTASDEAVSWSLTFTPTL